MEWLQVGLQQQGRWYWRKEWAIKFVVHWQKAVWFYPLRLCIWLNLTTRWCKPSLCRPGRTFWCWQRFRRILTRRHLPCRFPTARCIHSWLTPCSTDPIWSTNHCHRSSSVCRYCWMSLHSLWEQHIGWERLLLLRSRSSELFGCLNSSRKRCFVTRLRCTYCRSHSDKTLMCQRMPQRW